ncbi:MAG: DUF4339 domain-containing protein [Chitinophagaceae bacterium]|nr:MAG: DUF4339 domain-containing protein [Chitinophagaceae bacterium]
MFHLKQWYFLDDEHKQQGPISSTQLLDKLREGQLDGMNMVFTTNMPSWQRIGEIKELKDELRKLGEEEGGRGGEGDQPISNPSTSGMDSAIVQVFDPEILHDKAIKEAAKEFFTSGLEKGDGGSGESDEESDDVNKMTGNMMDDGGLEGGNSTEDGDENNTKTLHTNPAPNPSTKPTQKRRKKKRKVSPSTWIYITGLPEDISYEEIKTHFSKVGLIDLSPIDQQPRIKIYIDSDGKCKGDAVLCYFSEVSFYIHHICIFTHIFYTPTILHHN